MKPSGLGLLFAGRFLITVSISVLLMGLLRFSISSWFSFGSYTFLRIHPFLPSYPFYWHIVANSSLLWPFVFLCCLLWSLHFHFYFCWFFLCFLLSLANGLSILFIFSKNQLLVLIFAMVSFVSFAFISALIFKISFLLLTLGFFISSSCFRCRVRLFDLFLEVSLYCYEPSP